MKTYTQSPWSLTDLFSSIDSPDLEAAFSSLDAEVAQFEAQRDQLHAAISQEAFLDVIRRQETLSRQAYQVYGFASLSFSANTQSQAILALLGRVENFMALMQNRTLFFSLWWKDLDEANAERLMAGAGDYRYWLEEMRHLKPHTLSEAEEKIINIKDVTGVNALTNLYDAITNRYVFKLEVDGETKEMTRGELMVYVRHTDPALRKAAYRELLRVYAEDSSILGLMYQNRVRDWHNENVNLRHFATPIATRNLSNDIPDAVVEVLLEVCRQNASLFQRYYRVKARWLGMERLRRYDIYAPVAKSEKSYEFPAAAEMVLSSFEQFDPQVETLARRVFELNHLDSQVRKGKRSGAFCATLAPDITPWVHVNFQGHADDVATLAHELGHAIHSMLAGQHSLFTYHSSLPLAETASTFGEMMLIDRLLAQESDAAVRRDMIFRQVDDAYATILRQAYFALFERQAHELVQKNATIDELAEAYLATLKEQFGEAVEVSDEFRWEWAAIPHIYHTPFYVYAYAFGQLLVLSLYKQYKAEGPAFKPRYLKILSAGGSAAPEAILTEAGLDIRSAAFWQGGFDVLKTMIEQLEALPVEKS